MLNQEARARCIEAARAVGIACGSVALERRSKAIGKIVAGDIPAGGFRSMSSTDTRVPRMIGCHSRYAG